MKPARLRLSQAKGPERPWLWIFLARIRKVGAARVFHMGRIQAKPPQKNEARTSRAAAARSQGKAGWTGLGWGVRVLCHSRGSIMHRSRPNGTMTGLRYRH